MDARDKIYDDLYSCSLKDIDKALTKFFIAKKQISKLDVSDPSEFEY